MSVDAALLLARVIEGWLIVGLLVALPFAFVGVSRLDPDARGATPGFRLVIVPGAMLLWPLVLRRWMTAAGPPVEHNAHRDGARTSPATERTGPRAS